MTDTDEIILSPEQLSALDNVFTPEWIKVSAFIQQTGVTRSTTYNWIRAGMIKSALVKRTNGDKRGTRVVNMHSFYKLCETHTEQNPIQNPKP